MKSTKNVLKWVSVIKWSPSKFALLCPKIGSEIKEKQIAHVFFPSLQLGIRKQESNVFLANFRANMCLLTFFGSCLPFILRTYCILRLPVAIINSLVSIIFCDLTFGFWNVSSSNLVRHAGTTAPPNISCSELCTNIINVSTIFEFSYYQSRYVSLAFNDEEMCTPLAKLWCFHDTSATLVIFTSLCDCLIYRLHDELPFVRANHHVAIPSSNTRETKASSTAPMHIVSLSSSKNA